MKNAQPLLLNFNDKNIIEVPDTYSSSINFINAVPTIKLANNFWDLPGIGEVRAVEGVFIRPDGFVAWVHTIGEPLEVKTLTEALNRWLN
jgi:hypothetical protein